MPVVPGREDGLESLQETVATGLARIAALVSVALAFEADQELQGRLRTAAAVEVSAPILIPTLTDQVWLRVDPGGVGTLLRHIPEGLASIDLDRADNAGFGISEALDRAIERRKTQEEAMRLLKPLAQIDALPSVSAFKRLMRFSALIEQPCYQLATAILGILDAARPHVLRELSRPKKSGVIALRQYWSMLHTAASLILLASDSAAGSWLSKMGRALNWTDWTPSFGLVRERTVWLVAAGARSAAAFGPGVVEPYVQALAAAATPFRAFDALLGLTAIAVGHPNVLLPIRQEIVAVQRQLSQTSRPGSQYFEEAFRGAIRTIDRCRESTDPSVALIPELEWDPSGGSLATAAAMRADPASRCSAEEYVGFLMLAALFDRGREHHFAAGYKEEGIWLTPDEIGAIIGRSWRQSPASTVH